MLQGKTLLSLPFVQAVDFRFPLPFCLLLPMSTFRTDQLSAIYICSVNFPLVSIWILRFVSFIYFLRYILLIILLQLSWFFLLCPSPHRTPHSLRQFPHHCSCPWVMRISSLATPFPILCFTSPWLFCNYLFILPSPLTSSPIPPHPSPIWQPSKLYPWFCLCSCLLSLFFNFNCCYICILAIYCSKFWSSFS